MAQAKAQSTVFASVGRRAGALLLDLWLLIFLVGALIESGLPAKYLFPSLAFLYLAGMPLTPLQGTLGKWICRIKLCDRLGKRLGWRAAALRAGATRGWCVPAMLVEKVALLTGVEAVSLSAIWWLIFFLPWAPAGFLPRRESLFDLLSGTLVVLYRADTESIVEAETAQSLGAVNVIGNGIVFLGAGAVLSVVSTVQHDTDRRARIAFAIGETVPLREKMEAFHVREQRWPTAADLGIAESTPYRDGGGYRLQADGSIVISFAVLPELKGRSITMRPKAAPRGKKFVWECSADPGLKRGYLPGICR